MSLALVALLLGGTVGPGLAQAPPTPAPAGEDVPVYTDPSVDSGAPPPPTPAAVGEDVPVYTDPSVEPGTTASTPVPAPTAGAAALGDNVPVKVLPDGLLQIGTVRIDLKARVLFVPGYFCLDRGILEFLAVTPGGREYESVFALDVQPLHLQLAMILIGLEPEVIDRTNPATWPPPAQKEGSRVELVATWKLGDRRHEVPVRELLVDRSTGQPLERTDWVFTGSWLNEGRLMAEVTQAPIAVWYDPAAVVNLRNPLGNPYRGQAEGTEVNSKLVPFRGTRMELRIEALPRPQEPAAASPSPAP